MFGFCSIGLRLLLLVGIGNSCVNGLEVNRMKVRNFIVISLSIDSMCVMNILGRLWFSVVIVSVYMLRISIYSSIEFLCVFYMVVMW